MKKVAVIQSNYIPWKGYFDIINDVDLFIFYDDVQYTNRDWRNRNIIKTFDGLHWLTIPVGSQKQKLIYEVEPVNNHWAKEHWKTIRHFYSQAPYFDLYRDFFESFYTETRWDNLSTINQYLIKTISFDFLEIKTEFKDSREYYLSGTKQDRLMDLLQQVDATLYLSGPSAKDYINEQVFIDAGIDLVYKDYSGYPEYPQLFNAFEHKVSIIDLLFNCGPEASDYIWGWREHIHSIS